MGSFLKFLCNRLMQFDLCQYTYMFKLFCDVQFYTIKDPSVQFPD